MPERKLTIDVLDALVFDFDGVLTNNMVYSDQYGKESVSCNRGDGLGFDVLRRLSKPAFILSTEENSVVSARAKKLKITALQGITDKVKALENLANKEGFSLDDILYVGNDLNDYRVMQRCGYSVCPSDSHPMIKEVATRILSTRGGEGVVRELLEDVLQLDFIKILFTE